MKFFDGNETVEIEGTWEEHCAKVRKQFDDHYQNEVKPIIDSWPEWKRNLVGTLLANDES